jgi:hypothetical protein
MNRLFFWNEWKKTYKYLYLFLFAILFIALLLYSLLFVSGINFLIDWDYISQFDTVRTTIDQFTDHLINYSINTTSYISKERFFGTDIQIHPEFGGWYLLFVITGICICLTIITRLELVWFAIGMGFFIFFTVLLNTEMLGIWGETRKLAIVMIILYGGIGFYFQAYDEKFNFFQRLLAFVALTVLFTIIIATQSKVDHPFYFLANFGIIVPIVLTVIFITAISFDIVIAFLYVSTGRYSNKNSVFHFTFICLLYFINLLLIFLKKKGYITSDFISISVFIVYIASMILGIWGIKKRHVLFANMINFSLSSFLYISFAIISTATIAYAFLTGNDPLISMFEYTIIYSHMGMGIIFFLYILYNFWELFDKKVSAYNLMFKPRRMPFFLVRPLGIIVMLSLFLQSNMVPFKQAKAGYFNLQGDVYLTQGKLKEAKEKYYEGSIFSKDNIKSNYSLASVLIQMNQPKEAEQFIAASLDRKPTEYGFANLGNLYMQNDKFFYAFFTLKEGLKKFPESGYLHNNMAVLYGSKGLWDSTFYHLHKANDVLGNNEVVATNLLWTFLRINLLKEADSIVFKNNYSNYISFQINKMVSDQQNHKKVQTIEKDKFLKDSILNLRTYAYLYNSIVNNLHDKDTSILKNLNEYVKYQSNEMYYFEMVFIKCLKLYYAGYKKEAVTQLMNLASISGESSAFYYHKVLGLWAMEMSSYDAATGFFNTTNLLDAEGQLYKAISLLEKNDFTNGIPLIKSLTQTPEEKVKLIADTISDALSISIFNDALSKEEEVRYQFLHYRRNSLSESQIDQLVNSFTKGDHKVWAAIEGIEYYLSRNNSVKAKELYQKYRQDKSNTDAKLQLNYEYLKLLVASSDWEKLIQSTNQLQLPEHKKTIKSYFLAVANFKLNKTKEAENLFKEAIQGNPFNTDVIIAAAEFYTASNKTSQAYDLLVEATRNNSSSSDLQKAYAITALKLNLTSYADETLVKLKEMLSPSEYSSFKVQYDKVKAETEKEFQQF